MNHNQLRRSVGVTALIALVLALLPGCRGVVVPQARRWRRSQLANRSSGM
jgi:hypothetical protein